MSWKPIDTAPKDTYILVCAADWEKPLIGYWAVGAAGGAWYATDEDVVGSIEPTHWLALPAVVSA